MLKLVTSLLKVDAKYGKYATIAGLLLVFGYISLLALVYVAFNTYDSHEGSQIHVNAVKSRAKI